MTHQIQWGIIGCGDVTEVKSGPAFNKVPHSKLVAVMRRDAAKAADYARRHGVPKWYSDATALVHDKEVNAIYIATPPGSHAQYVQLAAQAGKPVYVEKPMAINTAEATAMTAAANAAGIKLSVAHYRRAMPYFKKIKQLLDEGAIGKPLLAEIRYHKMPLTPEELLVPKAAWRVDPTIAGGGLFHDMAPHQLDLMFYFFGAVKKVSGIAASQGALYAADDIVAGNILYENGMLCNGTWCFNAPAGSEADNCIITGTTGKIVFSFFEMKQIELVQNEQVQTFTTEPLQHVQQPMIEKVTAYFRGVGDNPCSGQEGVEVMRLLDAFTSKR
jgi:predicted dehydrogenase